MTEYVEKFPKKGATYPQCEAVAMHMTDLGIPNPKNPQYTLKEWDKTNPLRTMLWILAQPKSQRDTDIEALKTLPTFTRKHVQTLRDLPHGFENLPKAYKDCLKLFMASEYKRK
jgi:hypothetical protein